MRHERKLGVFGDLQRDVEGGNAGQARTATAETDLDADDQVLVVPRGFQTGGGFEQSQVGGLAESNVLTEGEDAGIGDIEERKDADLRALDDVAAKPGDVAGSGGAGVDDGGYAARLGVGVRVHARGGAAPIDMRVQVDQARRDDQAGDIAGLLCVMQVIAEGGDFASGEGHVAHPIQPLVRVDDAATLQHKIIHSASLPLPGRAPHTPRIPRVPEGSMHGRHQFPHCRGL